MAKDSRTGRQLGHMWKINLNCAPINVLTYLRENSRTAKKRGPLSGPRNSVNPSTESAVSGPQNEPFGGHSVNQQKKLSKENIKRKITLSHEATPNYRRRRFIEYLKIYRERLSGRDTFQPTAKDFRNLDIWLREHPNTTLETFQRCLGYRAQSVAAGEVSAAEEIYRWIGTILEFSEGPLNRYGKPLGQSKEGKYGTGKTEAIASNLNTALERRRTGRMAGEKISNIAECISGAAADCGSK
ncbi:MAG: hypothetical protein LAO76_15100 [Acidobacteriia bacterium]|nr:hypothetical protein [Terriglobia bacterium]